MSLTIAIDGYSSCGKSTLAKALAAKLNYAYIDSGAMYRCVTLHALNKGVIKDGSFSENELIKLLPEIQIEFKFNSRTQVNEVILNGKNVDREIRNLQVSSNVSPVSAVPEIRRYMVAMQRDFGKNKSVVMDGRDIGTHVFPDADIKLFMTADVDIRIERRFDELQSKGEKVTRDEIKKNLLDRDHQDTHRKESPLIKADDAVVLDNTDLDRNQQLDFVMKLINDFALTNKD
ncbi:MAG: (d)CMP kinase [Bacteroidota bacterium]